MALTSLAQLRASSPSNAAVTNGQACVQRMASTTAPMPPPPAAPVAASKQSAFSAWVSSGMPAGSCGVDAGTPDPAFTGPPTCSSGAYWTGGESSSMRPGEACIACAKITFGGKTRAMSGGVNSGDCNTCHTLNGASGAPGRIALP